MSPTARTLLFLRAGGHTAAVTEHFNPHARVRQDLFGFIDVLAFKPDKPGCLAVQCTSGTNHATRRKKLLTIPAAKLWVESGNRIWVLSWSMIAAMGKRRTYTPRIEEITIGMFEVEDESDPKGPAA